jgi:hypothetical protein
MIDLVGHIGYALIFFGTIIVGRRNKIGWILRFLGESIWLCLGIVLQLTSIYIWGIVFIFLEVFNYMKWRNEV